MRSSNKEHGPSVLAHLVLGHAEPEEGLVARPHLHHRRPRVQVEPLCWPWLVSQSSKEGEEPRDHVVSLSHHLVPLMVSWWAAWWCCCKHGGRRSTDCEPLPLQTAVSPLSCVASAPLDYARTQTGNSRLKFGKLAQALDCLCLQMFFFPTSGSGQTGSSYIINSDLLRIFTTGFPNARGDTSYHKFAQFSEFSSCCLLRSQLKSDHMEH